MIITELKLHNYRNFADTSFVFSRSGAIIYGPNGVGKTNLLESICYFAVGKSFRNSNDADLIKFGETYFNIRCSCIIKDTEHDFFSAFTDFRKQFKIDGIIIKKISELYNFLKVIYFSPDDILMVEGSPVYRRSFLDLSVSQYNAEYLVHLKRYFQILKQRNALLKDEFDKDTKEAWDFEFAKACYEIINCRLKYLEKLQKHIIDIYCKISDSREQFSMKYISHLKIDQTKENFCSKLFKHLRTIEEREKRYQRTLIGPHLDDIDLLLDNKSARNFASHGQQRSIAISMKLAQSSLLKDENLCFPVLLFDDVFSDLDVERSTEIFKMLTGEHQILIATPNASIPNYLDLETIEIKKEIV
ncbi:MAG: DNA replication and repair protein RecF [Candidatus Cloacimonetes bacterium]|nr:DNA replication and repair protein RecF [Candidatus Cloacimonadota bacterium]